MRCAAPARHSHRGAGTVLTAGIGAFLVVVAAFAVVLASYLQAVHAARQAADLAAVDGARAVAAGRAGCRAAAATAAANGARLESCREVSDSAEFVVAVKVSVPVGISIPGLSDRAAGRAEAGRITADR